MLMFCDSHFSELDDLQLARGIIACCNSAKFKTARQDSRTSAFLTPGVSARGVTVNGIAANTDLSAFFNRRRSFKSLDKAVGSVRAE
jgi:hypothetical protein